MSDQALANFTVEQSWILQMKYEKLYLSTVIGVFDVICL